MKYMMMYPSEMSVLEIALTVYVVSMIMTKQITVLVISPKCPSGLQIILISYQIISTFDSVVFDIMSNELFVNFLFTDTFCSINIINTFQERNFP